MSVYVNWYGKARHQDWQTPPAFFAELDSKYHFDLDGAASDDNALLPDASTVSHPIPWTGRRVFCNPPWSDTASFVELAPFAELAVLLVPARTNARWFHRALALGARVDFFVGRPKFLRNGEAKWNSPVDCLLLIFGDNNTRGEK